MHTKEEPAYRLFPSENSEACLTLRFLLSVDFKMAKQLKELVGVIFRSKSGETYSYSSLCWNTGYL
jgi:hypothetical protein